MTDDARRTNTGPREIERSAVISSDGLYRYQLTRRWGTDTPHVLWIMLNPSTADGEVDDPTIRRCIGFSQAWSFDAMTVCNLYALRCTRPIHLEHHPDPEGPQNVEWLAASMNRASLAVLAWGAHKTPRTARGNVVAMVETMLKKRGIRTVILGLTQAGHPRHPLYVKGGIEPTLYVVVA